MSCLFISCGKHLHVDPRKLRTQVVKVIRELPHLPISDKPLSWWIDQTGQDINTYANNMDKSSTFGTGIELSIIAILYRRTIQVVRGGVITAQFFEEFGNPFQIYFTGNPASGHFEPNIK